MSERTVNFACEGEILYAASYGGLEDYTFTNSVGATSVWLDAVKERKAVVCESTNTFWMDFQLYTALVIEGLADEEYDVDPYLLFAQRYCYRRYVETVCGYFAMTEVFGFLYRMFSQRHKEPPDEYDKAYATFIDSLLHDVRFIVCMRRRDSAPCAGGQNETGIAATGHEAFVTSEAASENDDTQPAKRMQSVGNTTDGRGRPSVSTNKAVYTLTGLDSEDVSSEGEDAYSNNFASELVTSTPLKSRTNRRSTIDLFVNSPAAAEAAPETASLDDLESSTTEFASAGIFDTATPTKLNRSEVNARNANLTLYDRMPVIVLRDPSKDAQRILGLEPTSDRQESVRGESLTLVGLFETPADDGDETEIEITYGVRQNENVVTFTVIGISNNRLKNYGDRGRVHLDSDQLVRAIRAFDSSARLLDADQLDLYAFEIEVASPKRGEARFKGKRRMFMRFTKQ